MNNPTTSAITKANVGKFFAPPVLTGLTASQVSLVKTFSENFKHCATATLENTPVEIAGPILHDMYASYVKNVGYIVHGWEGNA